MPPRMKTTPLRNRPTKLKPRLCRRCRKKH